jgi:hypothetical protein
VAAYVDVSHVAESAHDEDRAQTPDREVGRKGTVVQ